jgi:hypothetical protein
MNDEKKYPVMLTGKTIVYYATKAGTCWNATREAINACRLALTEHGLDEHGQEKPQLTCCGKPVHWTSHGNLNYDGGGRVKHTDLMNAPQEESTALKAARPRVADAQPDAERTCETCRHTRYECMSTVGYCNEKLDKWQPKPEDAPLTVTDCEGIHGEVFLSKGEFHWSGTDIPIAGHCLVRECVTNPAMGKRLLAAMEGK